MPTKERTRTRGSASSTPPPADGLWPSHGRLAVRWIERNCVNGEGDLFGQPARLTAAQKLWIYRWYEYHEGSEDEWGRPLWRYDEALIGLPRGEGKTQFVGWLVALEFAGPPEIAPRNPNIAVAAASFEQADLAYSAAALNFGGTGGRLDTPLSQFVDVFDTETLFKPTAGRSGRLFRVAAVAGTNEGGNATLVVADELHEWRGSKERVFTVLKAGTRKRTRPGRVLSITTAGVEGADSLCERKYRRGLEVQHDPTIDPKFLFIWHEASDHWDLDDPAQVEQAILEASPSGGRLWDIAQRVRDFFDPTVPRFEAIRYFLNRWVHAEADSWLADAPGAWSACLDRTIDIPRATADELGAEVVVGVDVSLRGDSTAVVWVWQAPDGRWVVRSRVWVAPKGGKIDHLDVMAHLRVLAGWFRVQSASYDPRFFEVPAQTLLDEGLPMIEVPQSQERMVPACLHAYRVIVGGDLAHDGDPTLAAHVNGAVRREGERGWTLSKGKSGRHIDACIAMVLAIHEAVTSRPDPTPAGDFFVLTL